MSSTQPFWGYSRLSRFSKLIALGLVSLYLLGYQPVLGFPPIKKSIVRADVTPTQSQAIESVAIQTFQLPHPGYISTHFNSWHPGVDIATGYGMPIRPIAEGKVSSTTYDWWGLGHYVVIEHINGYRSTYGHMGRIYVNVGDEVKLSTILGEVGMTGRTSGPHTHLEVTKDGSYINPITLLPQLPDWPDPQYYSGPGNIPAPVGGATPKVEEKKEVKVDLKKELRFNL